MAIVVSTDITNLLAGDNLRIIVMAEVLLDSGTIYLCDDHRSHSYGGNTYLVGAFAEIGTIKTAGQLAAESFKVTIDGNRLKDAGVPLDAVDDFLKAVMDEPLMRRRINFWAGIGAVTSENVAYRIPLYAGYITNTPVEVPLDGAINIELLLDSIAERYNETTNLLRTDEGHQSISPGDKFYELTSTLIGAEQELYWGKGTPTNSSGSTNAGTRDGFNGVPTYRY